MNVVEIVCSLWKVSTTLLISNLTKCSCSGKLLTDKINIGICLKTTLPLFSIEKGMHPSHTDLIPYNFIIIIIIVIITTTTTTTTTLEGN